MLIAIILGVVAAQEYTRASTASSETTVEESILIMQSDGTLDLMKSVGL